VTDAERRREELHWRLADAAGELVRELGLTQAEHAVAGALRGVLETHHGHAGAVRWLRELADDMEREVVPMRPRDALEREER
jgi:hypothetical protein